MHVRSGLRVRRGIPVLVLGLAIWGCGDERPAPSVPAPGAPAPSVPRLEPPGVGAVPTAPAPAAPQAPAPGPSRDPQPAPAGTATQPGAPPASPTPTPAPTPGTPVAPATPPVAPPPPAPPAPPPVTPRPDTPLPPAPVPPPAAAPPSTPAANPAAAFVGSAACKKCHYAQWKTWAKTPHATALASLRATTEAVPALRDRKVRAGLDPDRDYSGDATCLPCHTTGLGAPGGYPSAGPSADERAAQAAGAVACEACHGPGELYVRYKTQRLESDRNAKFARAGLVELGLVVPERATCETCHNSRSPTRAAGPFDFDASKGKVHPVPAGR